MLRAFGNLMPGEEVGLNAALAHELRVKGVAEPAEPAPVRRVTLRSIRDALLGRR